jgi:hypothetical protein
MLPELNSLLGGFEITRLEDMKQIAFNERIDIKYFFSLKLLPWLISEIDSNYRILQVENTLIQPYKTVYYDTPSLKLYLDHHNGKLNRYKLRKRLYIANNISFAEIKFKSNKGITFKKRVSTDQNLDVLSKEDRIFFGKNTDLQADELHAQATNYFNRITLVSKSEKERITMDFNLRLERNGMEANLGNLVIAEVKKLRTEPVTLMELKLHELGIKSSSFSKYCTAIAMIEENTKNNNFKIKVREYKKVNNEP